MKKFIIEFLGTLTLVLIGIGGAVLTGGNILATSLSFGLTLILLINLIGDISGCHLNPVVSFAMYLDKRMSLKEMLTYIFAQVMGAIWGVMILFIILNETTLTNINLGVNGYGSLSILGISAFGALLTEIILTFVFIITILKVTKENTSKQVKATLIGMSLIVVHFLGIKLTGTSLNPARSLAPALFIGGEALKQVWVFILGPTIGAWLASVTYKYLKNID